MPAKRRLLLWRAPITSAAEIQSCAENWKNEVASRLNTPLFVPMLPADGDRAVGEI